MKRISFMFLLIIALQKIQLFPENTIDQLVKAIQKADKNPNSQNIAEIQECIKTYKIDVDKKYKEVKYFQEITPLIFAMDLAIDSGKTDPFETVLKHHSGPTAKVMENQTLLETIEAAKRNQRDKKETIEKIQNLIKLCYEQRNALTLPNRAHSKSI